MNRVFFKPLPIVGVFIIVLFLFNTHSAFFLEAQSQAVIYVDNVNGSDSNSGSYSFPLKTISKASSLIEPGGTVRIKKTNAPYEENITPQKSGSQNARITYEGWEGKPVFITYNNSPESENSKRCIHINKKDYITVKNITCDGRGNLSLGEDWKKTGFSLFAQIYGGSHNIIENNEFKGALIGFSPNYQGNGIQVVGDQSSTPIVYSRYNKILNNTMNTTGHSAWHSVGISVYSSHNLVEENLLIQPGGSSGSTHQSVQVLSSYNIVRNNTISNEKWTGNSFERNGTTSPGEHNVFEENKVFASGSKFGSSSWPSGGLQIANQKAVIRKNFFYKNEGQGLNMYRGSGEEEPRYLNNNHIYQNTVYNNNHNSASDAQAAFMIRASCNVPTGGNTHDNVFQNNILFKNGGPYALFIRLGCNFADSSSSLSTVPIKGLNGMKISGNLFSQGTNSTNLYYVYNGSDAESIKKLQDLTSFYSGLVYQNIEADPLFKSPDSSSPDFSLRSESPAIDAGTFLTKAYYVSTAMVRFDDPYYFIDGYGLIPGDEIKFKTSGQTRRIQILDYESKTAILDRDISLPSGGDEVALVYNGTAPDIGAVETNYTTTPPSLPATLSNVLFSVSPETSISKSGRSFTLTIENGGSPVLGPISITANTSGLVALPSNSLAPGSYTVSMRTAKYLSRKQTFVLSSNQTFTFNNKLLVGDLNNDNIINSLDWSNMSGAWFTNSPGNDLNEDGIVNSLDRALLIRNWFRQGE